MDKIFSKRIFPRTPSKIKVLFSCCNMEYSGTVTDISKNGMLIKIRDMCFPFESSFQIIVPFKKEILKVPVKVTRIQLKPTSDDSIGVAITNPTKNYLEFVEYHKSVL